jgi:hypothetical protein
VEHTRQCSRLHVGGGDKSFAHHRFGDANRSLTNRRLEELSLCSSLLAVNDIPVPVSGGDERRQSADLAHDLCPCCGGQMQLVDSLLRSQPERAAAWHDSSSPPQAWLPWPVAMATPAIGCCAAIASAARPVPRALPDRRAYCEAVRRQFADVTRLAPGLAQSGFNEIESGRAGRCTARSRRNLRD